MPAKSDYYSNHLLLLIFNAAPMDNIARDNILGSLTLTLALHTASPGAGGTQATNEISYTGYARTEAIRSSAGFIVAANQVTLALDIDFPAYAGGAGGIVTHFSIGTGFSDAMLYFGIVSPNLNISAVGNIPRLLAGTTIVSEV
jgi:hypothetical protein